MSKIANTLQHAAKLLAMMWLGTGAARAEPTTIVDVDPSVSKGSILSELFGVNHRYLDVLMAFTLAVCRTVDCLEHFELQAKVQREMESRLRNRRICGARRHDRL